METQVDVAKADAVAVIKRFDDAVGDLAKRHNITRGAALLKAAAAGGPDWFAYRQAQQIVGAQHQATPEPEPVMVSDAYAKIGKKAAKLAKAENISEASAFARVYQTRPDLAAEDKAFHMAKGGGLAA
jgi:hypothetical protein